MFKSPNQTSQVHSHELLADDGGESLRDLEERLIKARQEVLGSHFGPGQAKNLDSVTRQTLIAVFEDAEEILVKSKIFRQNLIR